MGSLFDRYQKEKRLKQKKQQTQALNAAPEAVPVSSGNVLQIARLSHDGRGVARDQHGKTVFVSGALAGEQVTAQITQARSRYNEARISSVVSASPERVTPVCPHYEQCGGCSLQHLAHQGQVAHKQATLQELFRRENIPLPSLAAPITASAYGYRRKARIGVKYSKANGLVMGFRARTSNELIAIQHCAVLQPALQPLLPALQAFLPTLQGKANIGHIELIAADNGNHVLVRFLQPLSSNDQHHWQTWATAHSVALWQQHDDEVSPVAHQLMPTYHQPSLRANGKESTVKLQFTPRDFLQVNPQVNQLMLQQAADWLKLTGSEQVLDLFAGFGNLTLPLAPLCQHMIGIEVVAQQVVQAQTNARYNELTNVHFYQADLSQPFHTAAWAQQQFDVVILDPPRAGAEQVCLEISQLKPKKILYVSCNPATLARDAKLLAQQGYRLTQLGMLDMFPQTDHMESMALFEADIFA